MSARGTARRGPRPSFDRATVLDAALTVFWEHGFEATSMADLGTAMGMNPPSIYAAFGNKQQLFLEVVDHYTAGVGGAPHRALLSAADTREGVEAMLRITAQTLVDPTTPRGCLIVLGAAKTSTAQTEIRENLATRRRRITTDLETRLSEDRTAGQWPEGADIPAFAGLCISLLDGLSVRAVDGATGEELTAVINTFMALWPEADLLSGRRKR